MINSSEENSFIENCWQWGLWITQCKRDTLFLESNIPVAILKKLFVSFAIAT